MTNLQSAREALLDLRQRYSRAKIAQLTGLTPTKVYTIEKGRLPTEAEATALLAVSTGGQPLAPVTEAPQSPALVPKPPVSVPASPALETSVEEEPTIVVEVPTTPPPLVTTVLEPTRPIAVSPTVMSAEDGFRRFANSEIQTFKECRRKWYMAYYRKLRLRYESPVGVKQVGHRIHRALQNWYVPDASQRTDPRDALERLIVEDWTALNAESDGVHPEIEKKFRTESDLERVILDGYVEWLAQTGVDAELVIVTPEAYVEAELPELDQVKIIAKLDVRVLRKTDGLRLWLEHKVPGDFGRLTRVLNIDEQVLHQTLVERLQSNDEPRVVGALFNMLRRVKRSGNATPPFYQRIEVHHNDQEIAAFRRRLVGTITNILEVERLLNESEPSQRRDLDIAYPTPSQDCTWKCSFFSICGMLDDGSRVDAMLNEFYEQGDPLAYYTL